MFSDGHLFKVVAACLFFLASVPLRVDADTSTGLVGFWRFDDGSGTSARDATGNGNTGTLTLGPTWVAGKYKGAVSFDGNNDYVSVANESNFDFERTDPFSLSCWFYRNTNNTEDAVMGKDTSSFFGYSLWLPPSSDCSNCLQMDIQGASGSIAVRSASSVFSNGVWTHVAVTYSGSSTAAGVKIYINGNSLNLSVSQNSLSSGTVLNNSNFLIGTDYPGVGDEFYGMIDDVRVYNRELSAGDVKSLYNMGAVIKNAVIQNGAVNQ